MAKRRRRGALLALFLLGAGAGAAWTYAMSRPTGPGPEQLVRWGERLTLPEALSRLQDRGIIRHAWVARIFAWRANAPRVVGSGTYRLAPGMKLDEVFRSLAAPIRQMVRLPEGWWIARTADRLGTQNVCKPSQYVELAAKADEFQSFTQVPLPKGGPLEGYLFPDTYDLPPLLGAKSVIIQQLRAFETKVMPLVNETTDLHRVLTIASMVELEAAIASERPIIAGVIENRLRAGMRLEIDATVLYALQTWKQLGPGEVRKVDSPYNTYLHSGLPPGPIGSPGLSSIKAALAPTEHGYLFYVAKPDRTHYFSTDYAQHLKNIKLARAATRVNP